MRFMRTVRTALIFALAALVLPAAAFAGIGKQYVLPHPGRERCKVHYVKKNEKIKKREHGRTVKVRETFCVYVTPKAPAKATTPVTTTPAPTTPTPSAPAAVPLVTPYAHLDPSFTQSPSNPLAVTYSYSASATETINGVTSPVSNLPSGVLNLYSDGLLKCSINVGGSTTGGECPVTYSAIGSHTVITTYTSGTLSSTETYVERIEPFPAAATQTTLHTTLIGCEEEVRGEGNENGHERTNTEHRCNYRVEAASSEPEQQITLLVGPRGEYDDPLALSITNGGSCTLTATNWTLISYPLEYINGRETGTGHQIGGCGGYGGYSPGNPKEVSPYTWPIVAKGDAYSAVGEGGGGWMASESETQTLTS